MEALEWTMLCERRDDELAIATPDGALTAAELRMAARAAAATLTRKGVQPGDRVVVALRNTADFVISYLAVRLCGAVLVNLPPQWRRELGVVVRETDARALILEDDWRDDEQLGPFAERRVTGTRDTAECFAPGAVARAPRECAWLAYSSGTTGTPKGAVHSEHTLACMVDGFISRYRLTGRDPILVAAPVGHAVGFVYGVCLGLRIGAPLVLVPRWSATVAAKLVAGFRCAFVAAPTPLLLDVVEYAERDAAPFGSLRFFLCGGAPVPTALRGRARAALPATDSSAYYGSSECGGVSTCPPEAVLEKKLTIEGVPLSGMEVRLEGAELLVRGRHCADRYWAGDEEGRFRPDGWFATGDCALIDADGFVTLTGRIKELIIRGGVNIAPTEIEQVLAAHPSVRDVAVIGVADERLGERLAAAIVWRGRPLSLEEARDHCRRGGLAKVKWPELLFGLDVMPRSATGKLARGDLRRQLEELV